MQRSPSQQPEQFAKLHDVPGGGVTPPSCWLLSGPPDELQAANTRARATKGHANVFITRGVGAGEEMSQRRASISARKF
jgi:hypothetical protein